MKRPAWFNSSIQPVSWDFYFLPRVRRAVGKRMEREALYDQSVPGSAEFLDADSRNFLIHRTEIERVVIRSRKAFRTIGAGNSGTIEIKLRSGRKQRFVLVGDQNLQAIEAILSSCLDSVQIVTQ